MFSETITLKTLITWGLIILGAGATWGTLDKTVNDNSGKIKTLQDIQIVQEKTLDRMDYNVQIIAQKIGVKPLKRPENE